MLGQDREQFSNSALHGAPGTQEALVGWGWGVLGVAFLMGPSMRLLCAPGKIGRAHV